jgi:hypothetical protein
MKNLTLASKLGGPLKPSYLLLEKRNLTILKNLKLTGQTKEQCLITFGSEFVEKNWDKF